MDYLSPNASRGHVTGGNCHFFQMTLTVTLHSHDGRHMPLGLCKEIVKESILESRRYSNGPKRGQERWWLYQNTLRCYGIDMLSTSMTLYEGNPLVTRDSPHKRPDMWNFDICDIGWCVICWWAGHAVKTNSKLPVIRDTITSDITLMICIYLLVHTPYIFMNSGNRHRCFAHTRTHTTRRMITGINQF